MAHVFLVGLVFALSAVRAETCGYLTGYTCRVFACQSWLQADCVGGKCVCGAGECVEATGACGYAKKAQLAAIESDTTAPVAEETTAAQLPDADDLSSWKKKGHGNCKKLTGGSCHVFGCKSWRKATCSGGKCVCGPGKCASATGACGYAETLQMSTVESDTTVPAAKEASAGQLPDAEDLSSWKKKGHGNCKKLTGGSCHVFGCKSWRKATCSGGKCVCGPGKCASATGACGSSESDMIEPVLEETLPDQLPGAGDPVLFAIAGVAASTAALMVAVKRRQSNGVVGVPENALG